MFTAIRFIIAKTWEQTNCPLMGEWIKKTGDTTHTHTHTHTGTLFSYRKEILPFATKWTDLEEIMLSDISQILKDKYCMISLIYGILKIQIYRNRVEWWLPGAGQWVI